MARTPIKAGVLSLRLAWAIAGTWDCLREDRVAEARARAALATASIDQHALDSGSWVLAQEVLLEQPPPLASFQHRREGVGDVVESYHSRLVDPRWADLLLHRVKEAEACLDAKCKLSKPKGAQADHGHEDEYSGGHGRGRGRGAGKGDKSAPARAADR